MEIAPDFFDYFEASAALLDKDKYENHKGRQFIRPEVCRTYNFGEHDKYTNHFAEIVRKAKPVQGTDAVLKAYNIEGDVRIQYKDQSNFQWIARQFGIFEEWKDGIPRTSFKGVVVFRYQTTRRIFLVGPDSLRQLGIKDA
ncbi:unnamed protein product [Dovyalis caffra]|uniref:Alpha-1,3-mannosyl-glycoprotein 2-beta-N-acetylglucosaminyltransferase n=1 Tax=Dovyalis caffra TaxID=77055 RepID=A0AAV1R6U9_9ROSI|nr:unnamed protein product [Dovyalis caffra]